ncbi:MAG: 3-methyl-2-oxobutanoate dehydrogenase subunit VorB [Candidatus Hydrogenedentes bacterium]|nr:3-methyl-2-oxobutanoate dehydrogenase subunit VorB [Candidatus Hydrogenedentota bacterium]
MSAILERRQSSSNSLSLVQGNIALAEGAVQAGLNCYFGFPISPQNQIPEYLSRRLVETGGVFLQAESELAGINMVLGAAAAGARVMTSSSGPGISLMQEGISFLAGSQLPCLIVDVMRSGPGLGGIKPTQADYYQATRGGGHGDYRTVVLAPSTAQEMFDFPLKAFEIAERYRNPVLILSDAILGQLKEPVCMQHDHEPLIPPKDWALAGAHNRPAQNIRSMFLSGNDQELHNNVLWEKYKVIEKELPEGEELFVEDAELLLVAFGSAARIALSALRAARDESLRVGLFRPITLYPFPSEQLCQLTTSIKRVLVVEMNMGQMLDDVRLSVPDDIEVRFYGRPGGGVPTPSQILEKIKEC